MRFVSLLCFFIASSAYSIDISLPIEAKNPECQAELTEREDFWWKTHKKTMLEYEIELHLGALLELRVTAISQANITLTEQIDSKIYDSLRYVLHRPEFLQPFKKHLAGIKESLKCISPNLI